MIFKLNIILFFSFGFLSCKPYLYVLDEYPLNEEIIIKDYFFDRGLLRSFYANEIHTNNTDSLFQIVSTSIDTLNLSILFKNPQNNTIDANIWKSKRNKISFIHEKLDTNYIKSIIEIDSNKTMLIPLVRFFEIHSRHEGGTNYSQRIKLSIFLIKNNHIIYSSNNWKDSKLKMYTNNQELLEIDKTSFFTQKDWDELVRKVMQPYIDRLK
jgi:hypothetical protein